MKACAHAARTIDENPDTVESHSNARVGIPPEEEESIAVLSGERVGESCLKVELRRSIQYSVSVHIDFYECVQTIRRSDIA
jgi:hypothetical protein